TPPSDISRLHLLQHRYFDTSTDHVRLSWRQMLPMKLSVELCPSMMIKGFYTPAPFTVGSSLHLNATTRSTTRRCWPLLNVWISGDITSKDQNTNSKSSPITKTSSGSPKQSPTIVVKLGGLKSCPALTS